MKGWLMAEPLWLLLLIPAIGIVLWSRHGGRRIRSPHRRRLGLMLRFLTLLCLISALAGLSAFHKEDHLTVLFAVDGSRSVGLSGREEAVRFMRSAAEALKEKRSGRTVEVGVIGMGREAKLDTLPTKDWRAGEVTVVTDPNATDLGSALRLADGVFPPGHEARLVMLTDGIETTGSVEQAVAAVPEEVDLLWFPVGGSNAPEVSVEQIVVDETIRLGQPHTVRIVLGASHPTGGTLRLFRGSVPIVAGEVTLKAGRRSVFAVDLSRPEDLAGLKPGVMLYRARIEALEDGVAENNEAAALVNVEGDPSVLIIDRDPAALGPLLTALQAGGIRAVPGGPSALPSDLLGLAAFAAIVLSDVAATHFSERQLDLLRSYVEDLGGGLVMLGGPESFGPGGYWGTSLEQVLPVSMDVKQQKHMASLGLVLCLDKSGSMSGSGSGSKIWIAKAAAIEAAKLLRPLDQIGIVTFDGATDWIVPMMSGREVKEVVQKLGTPRAGGGTDAYPAMKEALQALMAVETRVKHVVLLTDGQLPGRDHEGLAGRMASEGISLSTIGVGSDADSGALKAMADAGGGSYYAARSLDRVPRIFLRETFKVGRSWFMADAIIPLPNGNHPILRGLHLDSLPILEGYVATVGKSAAEHPLKTPQGDPLLSLWRAGLGKTVAFTSDAKGLWTEPWLRWRGYQPFWAAVVRWAIRDTPPGGLRLGMSPEQGAIRFTAEVEDRRLPQSGGDSLAIRVVDPEGETREVEMMQKGPGHYEGEMLTHMPGPHWATVARPGAGGRHLGVTATAMVPYSDEFRSLSRSADGLERLVAKGRARIARRPEELFERLSEGGIVRRSSAPWLLALAAFFWVLEVATRKLAVPNRLADRLGWFRLAQVGRRIRYRFQSIRLKGDRPPQPKSQPQPSRRSQVARDIAEPAPVTASVREPRSGSTSDGHRQGPGTRGTDTRGTDTRGTDIRGTKAEPELGSPARSTYTSRLLEAKRRSRSNSRR